MHDVSFVLLTGCWSVFSI